MANTKIPSELIADSSITAAKLADGTITTADIADSNVTTAKIADSNVTTAKIGDAQVTTAKITDANVTTGKIADDAVTTAKMASNSVTSDTLASGLTLAGNTNVSGTLTTTGNLLISSANSPKITLTDTTNTTSLLMYSQDGDSIIGTYSNHPLKLFSNSGLALTLDTSQNATFAGTISSGAISASTVGVTNIVTNKVVKFNGTILDDSNITDTGSLITLGSNTTISGDLLIQKGTGTTSVSELGFTNAFDTAFLRSSYTNPSASTETYLAFHTNTSGATNGTVAEQMRIVGNKVGIGTDNPVRPLHIHTTSNSQMQFTDNTSGSGSADGLRVGWNGSVGQVFLFENADLRFATNNDEKMRILANGNVGIGTDAPANPLSISVQSHGLYSQHRPSSGVGVGQEMYYKFNTADGTPEIFSSIYTEIESNTNGAESGKIALRAAKAGSLETGLILIGSTGNVGIGTTGPDTLLELRKDTASGSYGAYPTLSLRNDNAAGYSAIHFQEGSTQRARVEVGNNSGTPYMGLYTTNAASGITIKDGVVGIGTTGPTMPLSVKAASNAYAINMHGRSDGYSELYGSSSDGSTRYAFLQTHSAQTKLFTLVNTPLLFGTNSTESYRIRPDGGLQFPDNNTFIATSDTAGGTAFEWGAFRRPASSDGGQLTVRQYSSGDTAANYPAYASSNGSGTWDENTGVYFPELDQVGLTANGNPTLTIEDGRKIELYENGFTSGDANRGQRVCLGGISHIANTNPGGTGSGTYLHIKTNLPHSNIMFRFEYKGISYDSQNMDTSIIGYTYAGVSYVHSPQIQDTGNTTYNFKTPYYSSDSKLVLVLQVANNYTGGILWAQFVGSHTMAPGTIAIASCIYSSSTSGAF